MKLQRSTLILVGVAFLLGSGVLITEAQRRRTPDSGTEQASDRSLFDFSEDAVVSLQVQRDGETLAFEQDSSGDWQMRQPEQAVAEPGAIAFLLSQLTTGSPQQAVTMDPSQQEAFGFLSPSGRVELTLADGTSHELILGGPAFSGDALYVLVDPESMPLPDDAEATTVYVVGQNLANGVDRPVDEWKMATATEAETTVPGAADATTDEAAPLDGRPEAAETAPPADDDRSTETPAPSETPDSRAQ